MNNLIWQFHKHAGRARDGSDSLSWARASSQLLVSYAMKYQVEYQYSATPEFWKVLPGVGPGHERFQLFKEEYDKYDYILYADTDILFSNVATNIFEEYGDCDIASFNWPNPQDEKAFSEGRWLSTHGLSWDFYKSRYVSGGLYLMSRKFRQTLRPYVMNSPFDEKTGLPLSREAFSDRWPCGDQSIISFYLCFFDLKYIQFAHSLTRGPQAYNFCGAKNDENIKEYF
ncbi:MAG: hypothetical protein ABJ364_00030, partial [Lentilitoribacter sp.]